MKFDNVDHQNRKLYVKLQELPDCSNCGSKLENFDKVWFCYERGKIYCEGCKTVFNCGVFQDEHTHWGRVTLMIEK